MSSHTSAPPAPAATATPLNPRRWTALVLLCLAQFMLILDGKVIVSTPVRARFSCLLVILLIPGDLGSTGRLWPLAAGSAASACDGATRSG